MSSTFAPGGNISEGPLCDRPRRRSRRDFFFSERLNVSQPGVVQVGQPPRARVRGAWPVDRCTLEFAAAERAIRRDRPPHADVPLKPRDRGSPCVVAFVLGPVGAPSAVHFAHARISGRRFPQRLVAGEVREVDAGKRPRDLQLPAEDDLGSGCVHAVRFSRNPHRRTNDFPSGTIDRSDRAGYWANVRRVRRPARYR